MVEQNDILEELKLMADMWDDHEDPEMSVFFVRCIGEIRKLREALHPFANHPEFHAPDEWAVTVIDRAEPDGAPVAGVTAGDFRRAHEVMRPLIAAHPLMKPISFSEMLTPNNEVSGAASPRPT